MARDTGAADRLSRAQEGGGLKLVLIHGPVASGKLTVARALATRTGFALFHNHLVVDAVGALFPFGSDVFVRLRDDLWLTLLTEAARSGRDTIFTYAPEPTVAPDFIERLIAAIAGAGGETIIVALTVLADEQERRLKAADRAAFGKMRDVALLRQLRADMDRCSNAMPAPALSIDTGITLPDDAARQIAALVR